MAYPTNKTKIDLSKLMVGHSVLAANGMIGEVYEQSGTCTNIMFENFRDLRGREIRKMYGPWNHDGTKTINAESWPPGMDIVKVL